MEQLLEYYKSDNGEELGDPDDRHMPSGNLPNAFSTPIKAN